MSELEKFRMGIQDFLDKYSSTLPTNELTNLIIYYLAEQGVAIKTNYGQMLLSDLLKEE